MKFSQVPALGVRACMSSSTPWSLSVLTLSVRSVLPSISVKISALQISDFSILNSSAHTPRYRRFACILTNADARLAVEVVVSLLPPVGLSPTTLHQLAWRTTHFRLICSQQSVVLGLDVRVLSGRDYCWKIESLAEPAVTGLGQPRPAVSGHTGLLLYRIESQI